MLLEQQDLKEKTIAYKKDARPPFDEHQDAQQRPD